MSPTLKAIFVAVIPAAWLFCQPSWLLLWSQTFMSRRLCSEVQIPVDSRMVPSQLLQWMGSQDFLKSAWHLVLVLGWQRLGLQSVKLRPTTVSTPLQSRRLPGPSAPAPLSSQAELGLVGFPFSLAWKLTHAAVCEPQLESDGHSHCYPFLSNNV